MRVFCFIGCLLSVVIFRSNACSWQEDDGSPGQIPLSVLQNQATLTLVESIFYSSACSHTFTEHRTAVVDGTTYAGGEKVYTFIGDNARTDISWSFSGLPVSALKATKPTFTVTYTIGPEFTLTTSQQGAITLSVPTAIEQAFVPSTSTLPSMPSSAASSAENSSSSSSSSAGATATVISSSDSGLSGGAIGGIIAGVVVGAIAIVGIAAFAYVYVKRLQHQLPVPGGNGGARQSYTEPQMSEPVEQPSGKTAWSG